MTEDQAKTKWCPRMSSVPMFEEDGETGAITIRSYEADGQVHCIGSACMMWRSEPEKCATIHNEYVKPADEGLGDGWVWKDCNSWGWFRDAGYCGLAGKP